MSKSGLSPIQRTHETIRKRYGKDYYKKMAANGGAAPHKRRGFSDPEVARKAAKKRWKNHNKTVDIH